jgi:ribosome recycling factor
MVVMADNPLKSAYELAMDKLRERDRERGIKEDKALSQDQKKRIEEIRTQLRAKVAELEILWKSRRTGLSDDPEALQKAERDYVAERAKVEERAESSIAIVRREP